jgi:hypothetical protein
LDSLLADLQPDVRRERISTDLLLALARP